MQSQSISRITLTLIISLALLGILAQTLFGHSDIIQSGHAIGSDDAYITYRYAENFYKGHGIVFNSNERVEGYSNLLYLLLLTPGFLFGSEHIYYYSVLLNTLFYVITLLLFYQHCVRNLGQARALLGCALLGLNPWMWVNIAAGLETSLSLLIATCALIGTQYAESNKSRFPALCLTMISTASVFNRVDGFLLPIIISTYLLIKKRIKLAVTIAAYTIFIMGCYTLWRMYYYDDVIANTYYAKISETDPYARVIASAQYLASNFLNTGLWAYAIPIIWAGLIHRGIRSINFYWFFPLLWIGYLFCIGGDIYYERFLIVLFPYLTYTVLSIEYRSVSSKALGLITSLIIICQGIFVFSDGRFEYMYPKYDFLITLGKHVAEKHPDSVIAVDAAGKIPYFSGLRTIDMLGLNDKHIAKLDAKSSRFLSGHTKFDAAYVLNQKPDLIITWLNDKLGFAWGMDKEKYSPAYEIAYLVNTTRQDLGTNIMNANGLNDEEIAAYVLKGFNYGVLVRKDVSTP